MNELKGVREWVRNGRHPAPSPCLGRNALRLWYKAPPANEDKQKIPKGGQLLLQPRVGTPKKMLKGTDKTKAGRVRAMHEVQAGTEIAAIAAGLIAPYSTMHR